MSFVASFVLQIKNDVIKLAGRRPAKKLSLFAAVAWRKEICKLLCMSSCHVALYIYMLMSKVIARTSHLHLKTR